MRNATEVAAEVLHLARAVQEMAKRLEAAEAALLDLFVLVPPERQHLIRPASRPAISAASEYDEATEGGGGE